MNMRTPLSKVRGIGSAKDGTHHFWYQRLSAAINIPLILFLVWQLVSLNGGSHTMVIERLSSPLVSIAFLMLMLSGIYHMRLGMQVVIEDYVHGEVPKLLLLFANYFFAFAVAAISIFSLLKISFGG